MTTVSLTPVTYSAQPARLPIDYFKIPVDLFKSRNLSVNTIDPRLDAHSPYISLTTLQTQGFDPLQKDTTIFNLQTNSGKSTLIYDLVSLYTQHGYKVILCSPFTRLVQKDEEALTKKGIRFTSYRDLQHDQFDGTLKNPKLHNPVQIMTIHCLLGYPGRDEIEQGVEKKGYMEDLFRAWRGEKVVIIMDEIHETTEPFSTEYIPNLMKWRGVTQKVIISSATFSPAAVGISMLLSLLVNNKVTLIEGDRFQLQPTSVSDIQLHIVEKEYMASNLESLHFLVPLIDRAHSAKKKVNIILPYRSMVNAVVLKTNMDPLAQSIRKLKPAVIDGRSKDSYDDQRNNVGTAFKTGVNITSSDCLMIVVLPYKKHKKPLEVNSYGVFTDGNQTIVQMLGRLRKKGAIHVIMGPVDEHLSSTSLHTVTKELTSFKPTSYETQNYTFNNILDELSKKMADPVTAATGKYVTGSSKRHHSSQVLSAFPTLENLLVSIGSKAAFKKYTFGKDLYPLTLWMALHDQFCQAKLSAIHVYRSSVKLDQLENPVIFVQNLKRELPELHQKCGNQPTLQDTYEVFVAELLNASNNTTAGKISILYKDNKVNMMNLTWDQKIALFESAVRIHLSMNSIQHSNLSIQKKNGFKTYVNSMITWSKIPGCNIRKSLTPAFLQLDHIKQQFVTSLKSQIQVSPTGKKFLTMNAVEIAAQPLLMKFQASLEELVKEDPIFCGLRPLSVPPNFTEINIGILYDIFTSLKKQPRAHNRGSKWVDNPDSFSVDDYEVAIPGIVTQIQTQSSITP